jgi:signal transduction histidine kinase
LWIASVIFIAYLVRLVCLISQVPGVALAGPIITSVSPSIDKRTQAKYYVDFMDDAFAVARTLMAIEENERRAIARELHDRLGQSLAVLKLLLGEAINSPSDKTRYTLAEAQSLVKEMMSLARDLSLELRPKMLDDLGLLPAFLYLFESFTSRRRVVVKFEHYGLHKKFPAEIGLAAYRIVQEALENVANHAGTAEARVTAWSDRRLLCVRVEDHGAGFVPEDVPTSYAGGISGMQARTIVIDGRFSLTSVPGEGTVVSAEFPLPTRPRKEQPVQ